MSKKQQQQQETVAPKQVKEVKAKKGSKRVPYPGIKDKDAHPFAAVPSDFDFAVHKPLSRKNFKDMKGFLEYRVAMAEHALARAKTKLDEYVKTGGKSSKLNKFKRVAAQLKQLQEELGSAGFDVEALLAAAQAEADASDSE